MAIESPPRFTRGSAEQRGATAPRWSGDDSVPRGLAVASAVMLRLLIVVGGLALFAMAAQRLLLVVLPFLIALLISTLLSPLARRLERSGLRPAAAAAAAVIVAVLVFAGLWALIIPAAVSQGDELAARVQEGLGEVADAFAPLGVDSRDLDRAVDQAVGAARGAAGRDARRAVGGRDRADRRADVLPRQGRPEDLVLAGRPVPQRPPPGAVRARRPRLGSAVDLRPRRLPRRDDRRRFHRRRTADRRRADGAAADRADVHRGVLPDHRRDRRRRRRRPRGPRLQRAAGGLRDPRRDPA